jgi:hypothetical protein
MSDGSIEKVSIFAYTDRDLQSPNTAVPQPFYLPINPENYSKNLKIETDNRRGQGNQGTDPRYNSTAPEELKLDFVFDGTDAIENYRYTDPSDKSVKKQLELFLKTVYQMEGEIHRPNFLKIHWGKYLVFPCVVSSIDIQYNLFESNGDPLRVKISATFLKYLAEKERTARERTSSPDLTQVRTVKAGDRLDLMTHRVYNDVRYLLQVARANKLATFRRLKAGIDLRFPPIDKSGAI